MACGKIVIGICTFGRVDQLKDALGSLSQIILPDDVSVEFVLVDNNPDGFAKHILDAYREDFKFPCHYFHEERRGLSYARNAILNEAIRLEATEIAMFDDDEIVTQEWLVELYKAYKQSGSDGVTGTVYRLLSIYAKDFIKRLWKNYKEDVGLQMPMMSTNNCLFSAGLVNGKKMAIRFDTDFNFSGREDTAFSFDAQLKGATFSSAPDAIVIEKFLDERCTFAYAVKRWFEVGVSDVAIAKRYKFGVFKRTLKEPITMLFHILSIPFVAIYNPQRVACSVLRIVASAGWLCGIFGCRATYYKHDKSKKYSSKVTK